LETRVTGKATMTTIRHIRSAFQHPLGPDDLRRAAIAYETALHALEENVSELDPYRVRQSLARFIMERALSGEHDSAILCAGALEHLKLTRGVTYA
jgi:hypothetical protein